VADIRRIAAAVTINREAVSRAGGVEVIRYADGHIITFANDRPASFFAEYLADVADIESYDDGARLKWPDTIPQSF